VIVRITSRVSCSSQLVERDLGAGRHLLVGGRPPVLRRQLALHAHDLALALADVHRDADRAALVGEPALDRLADPERRVRRELVALAPVELLGGADQAEDALLDQVEQRQLVALVLLRQRHDEAQVRVDHALLGLEVAALDRLGELDLLVGGQQRVAAHVAQEQLQRVAGHRDQLLVVVVSRDRRPVGAVVGHLDAARLEPVVEGLSLVLAQL
jgi:hypothetical protein